MGTLPGAAAPRPRRVAQRLRAPLRRRAKAARCALDPPHGVGDHARRPDHAPRGGGRALLRPRLRAPRSGASDDRPRGRHVGGTGRPATGDGAALLRAVIDWARLRQLERLELWVTEGNDRAMRLYERSGFTDTGKRDTLAANPALRVIQMILTL